MAQQTSSRRAALLCLGVVATRRAIAAPTKLAPAAVKYVAVGAVAGKACIDCSQFIAGAAARALGTRALGTCKIVEGEIDPRGHCIAFSPKARP